MVRRNAAIGRRPRTRRKTRAVSPPVVVVLLVAAFGAPGCGSSSTASAATMPEGAAPATDAGTGPATTDAAVSEDGGPTGDDEGPVENDAGQTPTDAGTPGEAGVETGPDAGAEAGAPAGLRVVMGSGGSPGHIVDGSGHVVQLHGANRSGTEFGCVNGAFFDGPANQTSIDAMKAWNINAVRVPMNEDCWLGINGVASAYGGANYQSAIAGWVNLLTKNGMIVIVDLHWTAPGTTLAKSQAPMADADHSPTFWSQVAKAYASNGSVIFDLFNEPYITDWSCWVSGGACAQSNGTTYTVAGMASLLKAVRGAGAQNVVILGGLGYSGDMSKWVASVNGIPSLPAPLDGIRVENVAASWHMYDFNSEQSGCPSQYNNYAASLTCNTAQATAMAASATSVLAGGYPFIIGESGISAYSASTAMPFSATQLTDLDRWLDNLLTWVETEGQGYLAWSWNTDTPPLLVTDYTGAPTPNFGQTYQTHLKKF